MESRLAQFDLDATADFNDVVSGGFAPMPLVCEEAIAALERAAAGGNLSVVEAQVEYLCRSATSDVWLTYLSNALKLAVRDHHTLVTAYLLRRGVLVQSFHVYAATLDKNTEALDLFFKNGWDINTQIEWALPPALAFAIQDATLTNWFLSCGADPNAQCILDVTPLSFAVQYSPFPIIQVLFDYGGSIGYGQLLHYAVWRTLDDHLDVLHYIIEKGAPINNIMYQNRLNCYRQREAFGLGTPLHNAAAIGRLDTVQALVSCGAQLLIKDSLGQTPLELAQRYGHLTVVEYLQPLVAQSLPPLRQFTEEMKEPLCST